MNFKNPELNPFMEGYSASIASDFLRRKHGINHKKKNASTSPMKSLKTNSANSFKTASLGSPMRASVGTQKKTKTPKRRGVSIRSQADLKTEARLSKKIIVIVPKNAQGIKLVKL